MTFITLTDGGANSYRGVIKTDENGKLAAGSGRGNKIIIKFWSTHYC